MRNRSIMGFPSVYVAEPASELSATECPPLPLNILHIEFLHFHTTLELGLCVSGRGICVTDGKTQRFSAGDAQIVFPFQNHQEYSDEYGKCSWYWVNVDPPRLLGKYGSPDIAHIQNTLETRIGLYGIISKREYPFIVELISRIVKPGDRRKRLASLYLLIDELADVSVGLDPLALRPNSGFMKLKPALNAVQSALDRGEIPSVSALARECDLTPAPFRRAFRNALGQSPQEYILACRMNKALRLLLSTDMSITQVALEVGYQDVSGFNRHFMKKFRMQPSAYKLLGRANS